MMTLKQRNLYREISSRIDRSEISYETLTDEEYELYITHKSQLYQYHVSLGKLYEDCYLHGCYDLAGELYEGIMGERLRRMGLL